MKRQTFAVIAMAAVLLVAAASVSVLYLRSTNTVPQTSPQCPNGQPLFGKYAFVQDEGCLISGDYAYTYVTVNSTRMTPGDQFTFFPSANDVPIKSGSVPVQVTYLGMNQTDLGQSISFRLNVSSYNDVMGYTSILASRTTTCSQGSVDSAGTIYLDSCPYPQGGGAIRLYFYFGPHMMPIPPRGNNIKVNLTPVNLDIVYQGSSAGYLVLVSQVPSNVSLNDNPSNPIQLLDAIVIQNNDTSAHAILSISAVTSNFAVVSDDIPSHLPVTLEPRQGISFTIVIRYTGSQSYTGPLDLQIVAA